MQQFKGELSGEGRTVQAVASYLQQSIQEQWQQVFQHDLEDFQRIFTTKGDPAYAAYGRALFDPLEEQLKQLGIRCDSGLPGSFPQSIEVGPMQERERRFWTIVRPEQGEPLGTIVIRFFHDHTQLRLPQQPAVVALEETDSETILQTISHLE